MSTDHDGQQHEPRERIPDPDTSRTATESVEKAETPDAVQAAKVSGRRGDDAKRNAQEASRWTRGVEWVRPTDLIARHGGAAAARGIDFQVELARRTRTPIKAGVGHLSDRARRLPPLSAFGRGATQAAPSRPGVGTS